MDLGLNLAVDEVIVSMGNMFLLYVYRHMNIYTDHHTHHLEPRLGHSKRVRGQNT